MPRSTRLVRMAGRVSAITLAISLAAVSAAAAQDASPSPSDAVDDQAVASPGPSESAPATFPLPEIIAVIPPDISTVSLEPESAPAVLEIGVPMPFTLGHCGLLSPVDLGGSFWQPVSGTDASGGPIEGDDEVVELISATSGVLTLTTPDEAVFTTALGSQIGLVRATGAVDYTLCM
jgi:hypothetical protein